MKISWIKLCGLTFLVSISSGMPDTGLPPTKDLPAGEPVQYVKPATNSPALGKAPDTVSPAGPVSGPLKNSGTQPPLPGPYVSPWLLDTVKLVKAGIDQSVILSFIDSAGTFNLTAEQIISLRDLGLTTELITAMMQHDAEIVAGLRQSSPTPSASEPSLHLTFIHNDSPPAAANRIEAPASPYSNADATADRLPANTSKEASSVGLSLAPDYGPPPITHPLGNQRYALPTSEVVSPVRQPYAVPLTDPIVIIRTEQPTPNLFVIELLP